MAENVRYCLYMKQNVVCSSCNRDGECDCLKCDKEQCDRDNCELAKKRRMNRRMMGANSFGIISLCNECLSVKVK